MSKSTPFTTPQLTIAFYTQSRELQTAFALGLVETPRVNLRSGRLDPGRFCKHA